MLEYGHSEPIKIDTPEFIAKLKHCAADPSITQTKACSEILHMNNATLNDRLERYGIKWVDPPGTSPRRTQRSKNHDHLLPLIRELAADPSVSESYACQVVLRISSVSLQRVKRQHGIKWIFKPGRGYRRGDRGVQDRYGASLARCLEQRDSGARGGQKTKEKASHEMLVRRIVFWMCPHLFDDLREQTAYPSDLAATDDTQKEGDHAA